jgi:type I restriction enzyme M protein
MSNKINQDEINNILWKACDTFRGVIDADSYKNYILVFLFLKYVSDILKEKKEEYLKQFDGDEQRVERFLAKERFIVLKEADFYSVYEKRNEPNIGEIINIALEQIEDANRIKLENVFKNIDFNSEANLGQTKERNNRLKHLIEDFADPKLDLRSSRIGSLDVIGNAYEYLIGRFASDAGKKGGEFYTPSEIATLLAKLVKPKAGQRIYDPTCGSGSLLIRVAHESESQNYFLYGQERNGNTWALAKMNMFLHGLDNAQIERGDTIENPRLIEKDRLMKFDIVVANPPFSLDKWGAENASNDKYNRFYRGVPPKSKGDYAFITHMIESLNEHGKMAVIVPHGVLFRGSSEGKIRQAFLEENLLEAVIGLPANLFYGTGIPAAILVFNKAKIHKDVLFIDASKDFEAQKNQNRLRKEDIEKIVQVYEKFESTEKYSHRATFEEIEKNDFNLNIPRYVHTFEEEEEIDIKSIQKDIDSLEAELKEVQGKMKDYLKELNLLGVNG